MIKGQVDAIVLNWNGNEIIKTCLDSLLAQDYEQVNIVVVDNGSEDGSLQLVKDLYEGQLTIIENGANLGFAGGCNVGMRASEGEFIVLVNSDARLEPNWVTESVAAMSDDPKIGMSACKIYFEGKKNIIENTGHVVYRDGLGRGRGRLEEDLGQYDKGKYIFCPNGCAAIYRRELMEKIHMFDEAFFAYADDIDVGFRGRLMGYECVYTPKAIAYHHLSASFGMLSPLKAFLLERNRLWVLIKCFPFKHLCKAPLYTLARYLLTIYGMIVKKGPAAHYVEKLSTLSLMWIACKVYLSTIWNLFYLLKERRKVMRDKTTSDEEFDEWMRLYGLSAREVALNEISY